MARRFKAQGKVIVYAWKVGRWFDLPTNGTFYWLQVGYNFGSDDYNFISSDDSGSSSAKGSGRR
jgi:hypothetical protein